MNRSALGSAAGAVGVVSLAALVWASTGSEEPIRPLTSTDEVVARGMRETAASTFGRRFLLVDDRSNETAQAGVFESARAGTDWEAYQPLPPSASDLQPALDALAEDVSAAWADERRFDAPLMNRMRAFGVAHVLLRVTGGMDVDVIQKDLSRTGARFLRPVFDGLYSIEIEGAEPVFGWPGGGLGDDGALPPLEAAAHLDYEDRLWGGELTVEAPRAGDFLFPWPATGAHVTVDGTVVAGRALDARLPLLVVELPQGTPRVSVTYEIASARAWAAIGGALGLVVSLLALLLLFRPTPRYE